MLVGQNGTTLILDHNCRNDADEDDKDEEYDKDEDDKDDQGQQGFPTYRPNTLHSSIFSQTLHG